ncbi:hypothetical protein [Streptomyces adelaidensis]|uniref:hypothetical protein n=1 Tax=Streptomyces adelaidensis TaxID=2796465 RepID=UPI0019077D41|nr:hypothetical protein [Streptomyces adelaidensis]
MNHRTRSGVLQPAPGGGAESDVNMTLLGIYLNDHLAGATAGTDRARYLARSCRGTAFAPALDAIATEIAQDRRSLTDLMKRLGIPARRYKISAGWTAEKLGRLKANGRLIHRSPLSTLIELEMLRLGVTGKVAGWQTLRGLCGTDGRLDPRLLDDLLERARGQLQTLEELHQQQVEAAFRTSVRAGSGAP